MAIEENVFWECKANGKPRPTYRWLKNGEALLARVSELMMTVSVLTVMSTVASLLWKQDNDVLFPK